jgi:hypothetical protein
MYIYLIKFFELIRILSLSTGTGTKKHWSRASLCPRMIGLTAVIAIRESYSAKPELFNGLVMGASEGIANMAVFAKL